MKIAIIVFSPSGNTLKAARMIETRCVEMGDVVTLLNSTGRASFLYEGNLRAKLEEELGEWDLLFVGGPIYAGHMERNVLNILEALPPPGGERKGLAVPFATYGGAHSLIALEEMGKRLKRRGYKSVLGLKIAAKHTLTETFSHIIFPDKPGQEEEELIRGAVDRARKTALEGHAVDASRAFRYAPAKVRLMMKYFTQEKMHAPFKRVAIKEDQCIKCGKCVAACPVNMFSFMDDAVVMDPDRNRCILCAECYHNCPAAAIDHPYIEKARERLNDGRPPMERTPSAVYG